MRARNPERQIQKRPIVSLPGAETYELVRDSDVLKRIEAELVPVIDLEDRQVTVDYYLCAEIKSLLLYMEFQSANGLHLLQL